MKFSNVFDVATFGALILGFGFGITELANVVIFITWFLAILYTIGMFNQSCLDNLEHDYTKRDQIRALWFDLFMACGFVFFSHIGLAILQVWSMYCLQSLLNSNENTRNS
jgi:hypothetical protein